MPFSKPLLRRLTETPGGARPGLGDGDGTGNGDGDGAGGLGGGDGAVLTTTTTSWMLPLQAFISTWPTVTRPSDSVAAKKYFP